LYLFWNLQFSVTQFADFSDSFQLDYNSINPLFTRYLRIWQK